MAAFVTIVADKTGYPEDALDPDQGMESDLGIDSIKRMEILGAVQKILPDAAAEAMRAEMDQVAELSTIRAIVEFIQSKMISGSNGRNGGAPAAEARPFDQAGEDHTGVSVLPRFVQVAFAEPADHVTETLPAKFRVLVTESADGFHRPLIAGLAAAGAIPMLLPRAVIEDAGPAALKDWLAALEPSAAPQGLIYLDSRAALPELQDLDIAAFREIQARGTKRFFGLMQALAPYLKSGGRVLTAMETGGLFGRVTEPLAAGMSAAAGVLGVVKALSLEWMECSSKVVDLDPAQSPEARAAQLVKELSFLRGRREVGYPGGARTILRTEPAALSPPSAEGMMIAPDWVVLATGGARGITAECLRTLAPYGPKLVLVGRSALPAAEGQDTAALDHAGLRTHFLNLARAAGDKLRPAEIEARVVRHLGNRDMRRNVDDFAAMGALVDYRIADVADAGAVTALMDDVYAKYGRIDMLVHGAGLIEDAFLENKTRASFDLVFDTKVDSAFLFAKSLRADSLKAICFFTSVAGRYGNRGQTDYAAANETLNRLAWSLRRHYGPGVAVKAINWGPWGATTTGAGMVTDQVRRQFEARGIGMVEAAPGRDLFFKEIFWSGPAAVESVGWVADGETMEDAICALPPVPGQEKVGGDLVILRNARRADDGHDALIWRFDLVNAPFVDHHRFDGIGVLPVAAIMQMMAELPRAFGMNDTVVSLDDLQMFKGLTLGDGPLDLYLEMEAAAADGSRRVTIRTCAEMKRLRYRGTLRFGAALPVSPLRAMPVAEGDRWQGIDISAIYASWLSHGPRFQTVTRLDRLDAGGATYLAKGTLPSEFVPVAASARWVLDPGLIDGLLQSVWIWGRHIQHASALPLGVQSVKRFSGDPLNGPLVAETQLHSGPQDTESLTELRVYDASGALCYLLENFRGQSSPALNRLGGGWQGGVRLPIRNLEAAQ